VANFKVLVGGPAMSSATPEDHADEDLAAAVYEVGRSG
jgi:hypothetical protein